MRNPLLYQTGKGQKDTVNLEKEKRWLGMREGRYGKTARILH
jgi:hypothetical protein